MNWHYLSILINICNIWHVLSIATKHVSLSILISLPLRFLTLIIILSVILLLLLLMIIWCSGLWCIMSGVNKVIDVAWTVSHCRLIRCKSPFIVDNKLVLVNTPLKSFNKCKFIPILFHWYPFFPGVKTSNQKCLLSSKVPSEYYVYKICLFRLWLLLNLGWF